MNRNNKYNTLYIIFMVYGKMIKCRPALQVAHFVKQYQNNIDQLYTKYSKIQAKGHQRLI